VTRKVNDCAKRKILLPPEHYFFYLHRNQKLLNLRIPNVRCPVIRS